jgi:hypothetical protein
VSVLLSVCNISVCQHRNDHIHGTLPHWHERKFNSYQSLNMSSVIVSSLNICAEILFLWIAYKGRNFMRLEIIIRIGLLINVCIVIQQISKINVHNLHEVDDDEDSLTWTVFWLKVASKFCKNFFFYKYGTKKIEIIKSYPNKNLFILYCSIWMF